jgi:two-component system chemotaxis sensor kinase CheA
MIEMVRDPLTHLVRNSIDHGIEPPADRVRAGKPMTGTLAIAARQAGNQILIEVRDDGRGIDPARLIAKARASGVLSAEEAAGLDDAAALELIFRPGFSTAGAVSAISGRGVGMDVVRANVERIGGTVTVANDPGRRAAGGAAGADDADDHPRADRVGGRGRPLRSRARRSTRSCAGTGDAVWIDRGCGMASAVIRGERLPLADLAAVLGIEATEAGTAILVVLRLGGGARFALGVEAVHDHEELVVKPAAPAVMSLGLYGGVALPDDNRPVLLLDAAGIATSRGIDATAVAPRPAAAVLPDDGIATLLFRDIDGEDRAIRLGVVERIDDVPASACCHAAGQMRVTQDGVMLPLLSITGALPERGRVRILRVGDGTQQVAYVIDQVIDIIDLPRAVAPAPVPGLVAGAILVGQRPVELVDAHWMFAAVATPGGTQSERPIALLVGQDGHWMREILRPMVEASGYRVAFAGDVDAGRARIIIADDEEAPAASAGVATLRLSKAPQGPGVWRYDRPALAQALAAAGGGHSR